MLNARNEFQDLRLFKATGLGIAVVGLAWALSSLILSGDSTDLYYGIAVAVSVAVLLIVLKNWSHGIYIFFTWLVFEDLIRNYAGNSTYMFFAKDVLIVVVYVSMLAALRRRQLLTFRPPFLICLSLFFWFCLLQILNPNSPTILYGLLGLKTYFLYMPLMFAGY